MGTAAIGHSAEALSLSPQQVPLSSPLSFKVSCLSWGLRPYGGSGF